MLKLSYDEIVSKIESNAELSKTEIESKVKEKMEKLSGLISQEGAAHIVANELGVKLFDVISGRMQVGKIVAGMRNVEIVAKIRQVYELREFQTANRHGKVASLFVGDETGSIRIVLWNDQADVIKKMQPDMILRIVGGYIRDNNGRKELHVNDRSKIILNPPGETVGDIKEAKTERKYIKNLSGSDQNVEIVGTIVQVFEPRFFEKCPECGKRARQKEQSFVCDTHGDVNPTFGYVMNVFLDDGTDNMRVVCFQKSAQQLLKKKDEEVLAYKEFPEKFEDAKTALLGEMVKFLGRVTKNDMFDRLEFIANNVVTDLDPEEEIKKLNAELEKVQSSEKVVQQDVQ